MSQGALVEDEETGRRGRLMDVVVERSPMDGRVIRKTAFVRPLGGGYEWETPLAKIKTVDS